jgi:hypothetical protein
MDTGFDLLGDGARPTWTMTIEEPLGAFSGKAFDPFSEGGIGEVEGVGGGFDGVSSDHLSHGLGAAKDAGFLGLFHKGIQGGEGIGRKWAAKRTHRKAPSRVTSISSVTSLR